MSHQNKNAVLEFLKLVEGGYNAALDMHIETGEFTCLATRNDALGHVGLGTPPQPYSHYWQRLAVFEVGELKTNDE